MVQREQRSPDEPFSSYAEFSARLCTVEGLESPIDPTEEPISSYAEFLARYGAAEPIPGSINPADQGSDGDFSSCAQLIPRDEEVESDLEFSAIDRVETSPNAPVFATAAGEYASSYAELIARCDALEPNFGHSAIDRPETSLPGARVFTTDADFEAAHENLDDPRATPSKTPRRRRDDRRSIAPNYCWLTYQEAADYAGWSIEHLRNLVSAGKIPVYGKARVRRFRQDMLDLFLADPDTAMRKFSQEKEKHYGR